MVSLDTKMLPGIAIDSNLDATLTTSPNTSSLSIITLPVWIPILTFKSVSVLDWKWVAQPMALSALKYRVNVPSPISLISLPLKKFKRGSKNSLFFLIREKN